MRSAILAGASALLLTLASGAVFAADEAESGMTVRHEVMQAQQKLKSAGLYNGKVDGVDGPATRQALKQFQRQNGLRQTGRLDERTESKLGIDESAGSTTAPSHSHSESSMPGPGSQK